MAKRARRQTKWALQRNLAIGNGCRLVEFKNLFKAVIFP
jgi:hypothetical protein